MKASRLNILSNCSSPLRLANRLLSLAFAITLLLTCNSALGQSLQPRPAARMISAPTAEVPHSRPRRVNPAEENSNPFAVTAESPPVASLASADMTPIERRAFEETNLVRIEKGLAPLVWDAELCRMARAHSERMAKSGLFSHEAPEGLPLKDRAHASGILHFRVIAENIAYNKGYDDPGGFAVERWMISSGHRANILYVGFQSSAIGSYVSADGSTYLTQIFIAR